MQQKVLSSPVPGAAIPYHYEFLKSEFARRQKKNARYSLRSYARQLGLHPSTLSSVLSGKRHLSVKDAYTISEKLDFGTTERKNFFSSLLVEKKKFSREFSQELFSLTGTLREESAYDIIAEWEHYVLLYLVSTDNFQADFSWMGKRIGVTAARAEKVFKRLLSAGMLKVTADGTVKRVQNYFTTPDEKISEAVRRAHRDSLAAAGAAFEIPLDLRDITSLITGMDPAMLPKMKKEIRRFHARIEKLAGKTKSKEVYEMVIALFPRTRT